MYVLTAVCPGIIPLDFKSQIGDHAMGGFHIKATRGQIPFHEERVGRVEREGLEGAEVFSRPPATRISVDGLTKRNRHKRAQAIVRGQGVVIGQGRARDGM